MTRARANLEGNDVPKTYRATALRSGQEKTLSSPSQAPRVDLMLAGAIPVSGSLAQATFAAVEFKPGVGGTILIVHRETTG